jgi:hypothetical protein
MFCFLTMSARESLVQSKDAIDQASLEKPLEVFAHGRACSSLLHCFSLTGALEPMFQTHRELADYALPALRHIRSFSQMDPSASLDPPATTGYRACRLCKPSSRWQHVCPLARVMAKRLGKGSSCWLLLNTTAQLRTHHGGASCQLVPHSHPRAACCPMMSKLPWKCTTFETEDCTSFMHMHRQATGRARASHDFAGSEDVRRTSALRLRLSYGAGAVYIPPASPCALVCAAPPGGGGTKLPSSCALLTSWCRPP